MLRGWRRSGEYFYRAINHLTCCPMYTIRLLAQNFTPSKSQKKVLRCASKYFETRNLRMTWGPASFTTEKYNLYKKYQIQVHGDAENELSETGFTRFLVTSPLSNVSDRNPSAGQVFGTFHQEYRCDGVLFAVGVLDVVPSGLSSVYFFYDPDMKHLSLGKFSALMELEHCQKNNLQYYYMGFYIHQCEKMRYKGEYKPSELLCPVTNQWYLLADVVDKIERYKFTPFEENLFQRRVALENQDPTVLEQLYPRDPPHNLIENIPIVITSQNVEVYLSDLTAKGKVVMGKILKDLLKYLPLEIFLKIKVAV